MEITKTDREWIAKLFEKKPDLTGSELLEFIIYLSHTDMRHASTFQTALEFKIKKIIEGNNDSSRD